MTAAVFFGGDVANPDTYQKFWTRHADVHDDDDAARPASSSWSSSARGRSRTKANKWQGRNIARWRNDEYDEAYTRRAGRARPGQARRAVHQDERPGGRSDHAIIPLVVRPRVPRLGAEARGADRRAGTTTSGRCPDWYTARLPAAADRNAFAR